MWSVMVVGKIKILLLALLFYMIEINYIQQYSQTCLWYNFNFVKYVLYLCNLIKLNKLFIFE